MMGYRKLCLLLLLSSYALAQEGSDMNAQSSQCLLASRFKAYKKYVYHYSTESRNGVVGTANLKNGPRVSCQVEVEVPQACRFIMHTRDCALSEVSAMDPQGQPVYRQAPGSEAFKAAMEKHRLKLTADSRVQLYPEPDEPNNILNIKRGIVSVLLVPVAEDVGQNRVMSTVHGLCLTDSVERGRTDVTTDVTLSRDLSQCDHFYSRELGSSPLALLQKLHRPMSKLITSTQDCDYQFENKGKHILTAICTEKHLYLPFSYEDNGLSSVVTQELSFRSSKRINNRAFDVNPSRGKPLHFEDPDDKAPVQTKYPALGTLRELVALTGTDQGQERPSLFYKLVSSLRALRNETLSQVVTEMLDVSGWLTWQALLQCGTKECTSAMFQAVRTLRVSPAVDALVYGLSLQANPDAAHVRDMLSMAQYKQSKAIMYALANTVKKFHKGVVTPVVTDVSKFMETLLNDCQREILHSDSDELSFLVLRVVGVMGQAMQAVSPSLISSVLNCAKKTDIALSVQKAAVQAFRLMDINDQVRSSLMEVYEDPQSAVEKRIAAYLILMKTPHQALVEDIVNNLGNVRDEQVKTFVVSHLKNIRNSVTPQMNQLKGYIESALKGHPASTNTVFDGISRNYKIDFPLGSAQSNIIFDGRDTLPKEVMLETTLKVFDFNYDIFEVNVEGAGFEPTIEALFGEKGFFPDSSSKIMYWAEDKAQMLRDVVDRMAPDRNRGKREVPQNLLKDLTNNVQKLVEDVRLSQAPEAIAYLRLLGNELGYMKTSEVRAMMETLSMYYNVFSWTLPTKFLMSLVSSTKNEAFAHYIFMENAFALPTASGCPLKFSLAGVFAPGAKGGLARNIMTDFSFMPSVGIEFITQMGVHLPDYVEAGLEMHTNMYHESSINAQVTLNRKQMRLSIPAPKSNIQLLHISNKVLSVSSGQTTVLPSLVQGRTDSTDCQLLFRGVKLCTILQYSNATSMEQAPYFPLTGETRFAVELQPTGDVSEYTATISDEKLQEGKKGRSKIDSLKLTLKAEGDDSTEATATLKYNRNKNILSTEVVIPDYDVEAGIQLAVTDGDTKEQKMRGITIDVTNRNIPQLTLVGRTRLDMMKDAMMQVQMIIPSLRTDASVTASIKWDDNVLMDLETVISLPASSYQQRASLKYDNDKFEVEVKSDVNSDIDTLVPHIDDYHKHLQGLIDDILDQKVAKTDMKLRHIVTKGIEAGNIWLEQLAARIPYLAKLQSKRISDLTLPDLPRKLFLQSNNVFRYQFNKDKMVISLPLPNGGKKSEELNIPTTLSIPNIDLGYIGLYIPAKTYPLPSFTIPASLDITVPLLGLAEASTKIKSNVYLWEGSVSVANNTVDVHSYIAQYKAVAQSPLNLLSYKLEGTGMISGRADENLKYLLNSSFTHSLIETSFSVSETLRVTNHLNAKANYKIEASSPLGLEAAISYSAQSTSTPNSGEVSGDGTLDGLLKIGSFYTNTTYSNSYSLHPLGREGSGESTLHFDSPFIQLHNSIRGVYENTELKIVSKTNVYQETLKHVAELKYKDSQLTLKCNAIATVLGKSLNNKIELGVSRHMGIIRIESQADDNTDRAYSLMTASLDFSGLEVNSEGSLTFGTVRGLHKASLMVGGNGLTTSGTNSIQRSPVILENIFNGAIHHDGATLSSRTKAMGEESIGELNIDGQVTGVEASLNGVLKGRAYDATTLNNMNVVLNRRSLTFTSSTLGTLKHMKTENSHTLILTLWTLAFRSKINNIISKDIYYKQDTNVDIKPFLMSFDMTNNLKLFDASLNNEGHLKLEPIKLDLSGSVKGAYGEEHNIKHTYELTYEDMAGTMKYSMSGDVLNAQISHNCHLEFAGLSSKAKCEARMNSEPLRFDSTIRTIALPFSVTIDALVNSDGELNLYGKHTGQLYNNLLVKAEPLALAYSHDSRLSTTHFLRNGQSFTNLDSKYDGTLTPNGQYLTWKVKSKLNNHGYNQDISTYNDPEKTGFEFSGTLLTDMFSKWSKDKGAQSEIQEFSMDGFLKYDKKSDCHIIEIPFIESLPAAFDKLKNTLLQALDSLQKSINNLDINQLIGDFRAKLNALPKQVRDIMQGMDLENKLNKIKGKLDYLIADFAVTFNDLELVMKDLNKKFENTVMYFATKIRDLIITVKDYFSEGHLAIRITNLISKVGNQLHAIDEMYKIKQSLVKAIHAGVSWLQELESKYGIVQKLKDNLSNIKKSIENFNIDMFVQDVNEYILSINLARYVEMLSYKIPSLEISKVMESMNEVIVNWIDEYEIPSKVNAVHSYIKYVFLKYNLGEKLKALMDQIVILIEELRIEETVQSVVNSLKSIKLEYVYDKFMQILDGVINQIQAADFRKSIGGLNEGISSIVKSMKDFDYYAFVDETNKWTAELTNYVNEQIKEYEIVQKFEAVRDFFREIQKFIFTNLNKLKNTKVADALKNLAHVIDTTFYNDIKMKVQDILEDMRQRILEMDIREEIYIYLHRVSESYSNIVAYITAQFNRLIGKMKHLINDNANLNQMMQAVHKVFDALKRAEIDVGTFTVPFTDLVIPAFFINLNKLQEISIPAQISVPAFTVLNSYTVPAFTIDFKAIKAKIVAIIDEIREFEIKWPDPEEIFGDLKVLYLSELPDLTLSEITLSEIKFPAITIPKLNLTDFEITVLPLPEIKLPDIPSDICIPIFGKLHGELRVNSPQFTLISRGMLENSTSTPKNPQFTANIVSFAKSSIEPLEYTFEAAAHLAAPRMKKLLFTETVKVAHAIFSVDHEASLTLTSSFAEVSAKTATKATTQMYTADLTNNMTLTLKSGISAAIDTTYNHSLDIPSIETLSQASVKQNIAATMESGTVMLTSETTGNGKWSVRDYFDEGTHTSKMDFNLNFSTAKLTLVGETDCKTLKSKQTLAAESVILDRFTVEARCETETPSSKKSVLLLNGEAHIGDLKVALTASHDGDFTGIMSGTTSNSLEFLAQPFELVLSVKNKVNSKIFLPLTLTGKVDLLHDFEFILNSEKQRAHWYALARFNQYKYSQRLTAENNVTEAFFHSSATGEANLDFLTVPLSIPEIKVPYLEIKTPEVRHISLWEQAGFKTFLTTPQQSFDFSLNLHYCKNPDMHSMELHLEPVYNAIIDNANIIQAQFEQWKDKVAGLLKDSYNRAKSQYIKHKIDTSSLPPKIFTVPGYKVPILDIEVSAFRTEMPAFSYFVPKEVSTPSFKIPALGFSVPSYTLVLPSLGLPVIHVPEALNEIKLPTLTLPVIQNNILIPAMGNITSDFAFKSTLITLSANAGLYNQSDIVARFAAFSASVFDVLNGKIDGMTSLTMSRGIKLSNSFSIEHNSMEANHECGVSLTTRSIEGSVANTAKINLPFLNLEFKQEVTGNSNVKPTVVSKKNIKFMFNIPLIKSVGKGNLDINWELESLSSYVSFDTSTQGMSDMTIMDRFNFAGDLENAVSFYLNASGLRSAVRTVLNSNITKQEKQKLSLNNDILQVDLNENFAIEVSLKRLLATIHYNTNNNVNSASFYTKGKHIVNGEVEFVRLTTWRTTFNIDASQPSNLGDAGLIQSIKLDISSGKQSLTWSSKEQLLSYSHACDLLMSNDESEVRMDLTESVEGHLAFLKAVKLPIYQRSLWDVLKFDQVTNMDDLQFLNVSYSIVYTKTMEGQEYAIPYKLFENGITFSLPEITIAVPSWVEEIQHSMKYTDTGFESSDFPDHFTLPLAISIPAFNFPFTNLHVEPFTVDPRNIYVPKVITTSAFEIMLPGLPVLSVPSYNIKTEFLQGKMSFLSYRLPQYEITVSSFTLPKSVTIGEHTFSLSEITRQIANFEFPAIVIPEQKIEIPPVVLHLPSSVFIPVFGTLSVMLKVSSPIHNVSTTASLEKRDSTVVTSLNSICTSTMVFLQYDLSASATFGFDNGVITVNDKSSLIHNDVNVNWQHVLAQNLRESRHTLNVDITSHSFTDVSFRFTSRKDGISASMSSPASGFLGLQFQRRSPSQLYGKLFSRYLSTPEKDTDVITAKATLRNSQKLILHTSWNWDFLHDAIEGTKERIPAVTETVLNFINKYHTAHFGFDLNGGGKKLKNMVSSVMERVYNEISVSLSTLQSLIKDLMDKGRSMYQEASDSLMSIHVQDVMDRMLHEARLKVVKHTEDQVTFMLGEVKQFLNDTSFTLPGSEEKLSSLEIVQQTHQSVSRATSVAIQRVFILMKNIAGHFSTQHAYEHLTQSIYGVYSLLLETVNDLLQVISEKAYYFINRLKDENVKIAPQVDTVHAEVLQSSKHYITEAKRNMAEYKHLTKLKIQEAYNALNRESISNSTIELISVLQSHLYGGLNEGVDLLRRASQSTAPYIKVTTTKTDIEIPLPFKWKSFNEWPMQTHR